MKKGLNVIDLFSGNSVTVDVVAAVAKRLSINN